MAIDGNLSAGQTLDLATPSILVDGVVAGVTRDVDERLVEYRTQNTSTAPSSITITTTESDVDIRYTLNGRTPTSKSPKYTGAILLRQNSSGDNTIIKARVFKTNNSNRTSKVIKANLNVVGGNTAN